MTTTREQIFRPEAVAHHARGRTGGRVFDLADRLAARAFAAMTVLLAVVAVLSLVLHVDESTTGAAVVRGRDVVVQFPAATMSRLHAGQPVEVEVGGRSVRTHLTSVGDVRMAGTPVVEAHASLPAGALPDASGTATVVLARRSLAATLMHRT